MRLVILIFGLSLVLLSASMTLARQQPPRLRWLEFSRLKPGQQTVYCRLLLPTREVQCSNEAGGGLAGKRVWSNDGRWGAYAAYQDEAWHLYRRPLNGHRVVNLTEGTGLASVGFPSWSPDGAWLAFAARRGSRPYDIYRLRMDGSGLQRLTDGYGNEWQPAWSPDGQWIVYTASPGGADSTLYLMRPDGSEAHPVLETLQYTARPTWSPDGQWILFESNCYDLIAYARSVEAPPCPHADFELYVIHPDGTGLARLTSAHSDDYAAAWSPDGEWIAFTSRAFLGSMENVPAIYRMRPDGSGRERLTFPKTGDLYPVWSPRVDLAWRGSIMLLLGGTLTIGGLYLLPYERQS